jgi:hypothetical protein
MMQSPAALALHVDVGRMNDHQTHHAIREADGRCRLTHALHPERLLVELCGLFHFLDDHRDVAQLGHGHSPL